MKYKSENTFMSSIKHILLGLKYKKSGEINQNVF